MARSKSIATDSSFPSDLQPRVVEGLTDAEDALWRQFANATTQETFCTTWLALQCHIISGVAGGVVLLGAPEENRPFAPAAFWPDKQQNLKHLAEVAERSLAERRGLILKRTSEPNGAAPTNRFDVAYPIQVAGRVWGVVALDVDPGPEASLREIMRQLQWGSAWMEVLFHRDQAARVSAPQDRLQALLSMIASLVSHERFHGAAVALVTALSSRLGCDRVSLGFVRKGSVQVEALSHSAQFGEDTNLIHAVEAAMDEVVDQQRFIVFPEISNHKAVVTRGHAELARQYGNGAVCSIPLNGHREVVGAITLERPANRPFDSETVELCESLCALVGPILETQRRDDRWLLRKVIDAGRAQMGAVIGPRHMASKLMVSGVLAVALFLIFAKGDYRVTAKTVIEPATRRALVAASNGYISAAPLKPGDVVRRGQILAKLDDRELELERSKGQSQEEQSLKQYYEALGNRNAAQVQIFTAQLGQARAQVALITDQLARTKVIAPFDGVIVTGDLSQSLGAPVERGQMLFEVAPLDSYRIILQVDERDIGEVAVGQRGLLVLTGSPSNPLAFSVRKLTPVSMATEGRNFFRVEAYLENASERLRPGMEGIGKIEIDRRRLIWIWTHEVVDWLRLKIWQWLP